MRVLVVDDDHSACSRSKAARLEVRRSELAQAEFFQRLEHGLGPQPR